MEADVATLRTLAAAVKAAATEASTACGWWGAGEAEPASKRAKAAERALGRAEALLVSLSAGKPFHSRRVRLGYKALEKAREAVELCAEPDTRMDGESRASAAIRAADAILAEMVDKPAPAATEAAESP